MHETTSIALAGIFVGGRSTRMEGRAKGLLRAPTGETLVQRWLTLFSTLGVDAVLVGRNDAYESVGVEQLADDPPGIGPLGGLVALLARAGDRDVIAVACDMPFVTLELLGKLITYEPGAAAVAPCSGKRWEPLFARYSAPFALELARQRVANGEHALQGLLAALSAVELPLSGPEMALMRDWDVPADLHPRRPS
jgi:molybdopterin-guanine dinucleotide biosynthesis protein A